MNRKKSLQRKYEEKIRNHERLILIPVELAVSLTTTHCTSSDCMQVRSAELEGDWIQYQQ
jgi:hypothetical protein